MDVGDPFYIEPGTVIHNVEIVRPINRGGQAGIVYLVAKPFGSDSQRRRFLWQMRLFGINQRLVERYQLGAMKIAKPHSRDDIYDEERILKKIQNINPHIAQEYYSHFGQDMRFSMVDLVDHEGKKQYYSFVGFVYECGGSLLELLQQRDYKPFTPAQTVQIAHQIVNALHALHTHDVVYNDLSPSNIMLREKLSSFRAKVPFSVLIDFGASEDTDKPFFRQVVGKMLYLPPERRSGINNNPMNIHGDTYSLGIIMYELLVGKIDLQSQSFPELLSRKERLAQTPPATTIPLSPALNQLVMDAISYDVQERSRKIPTIEVFGQRLEATPEFRQSGAIRAPLTRQALTKLIAGLFVVVLMLTLGFSALAGGGTPAPTNTPVATITPIPSQTPKPTATATPVPTPTIKPTVTLVPTPTIQR